MSPGDYVPCYLLLIMLFLYILISVPRWWCPLRPTFTLTSPMSRTLRSGAFTGPHDALILAPPSASCRTTYTGTVDGLRMEARWPTRYCALGGVPHSPSPRIYAVSTLSYVDSTSDFKSEGSQKHFLSQKLSQSKPVQLLYIKFYDLHRMYMYCKSLSSWISLSLVNCKLKLQLIKICFSIVPKCILIIGPLYTL